MRVQFGADGIRGIAFEEPLVPFHMVQIGQALGQFACRRSDHPFVVIGRDTRSSGANLLHCLAAGLTGQGVDVIDLDVMTTPGVAFLARRQQADLGVIVSASHSPLEYNGIKLVGSNGLRLPREEEIEIERLIEGSLEGTAQCADAPGQQTDGKHLVELYIQDHVERCPSDSLEGLCIVLDCADGAASRVAPECFRQLVARVVVLNDAVEGKSINYRCGSEYVREHPEDLTSIMQQHSADYGFAFDGDGDRLTVVDANGKIYDGNDLLFVLAVHFNALGLLRSNTVVTTHLANGGLIEALDQAGIRVAFASKGDKNLEAMMWGGDYLLGSEPGGNIIINDGHHTAADAVYGALVLSGVIVRNWPASLAELTVQLRKRPQVTITLALPATPAIEKAVLEEIRRWQVKLSDGSRVLGWGATTEPGKFRVMVEGGRASTLDEVSREAEVICQAVRRVAESAGGGIPDGQLAA